MKSSSADVGLAYNTRKPTGTPAYAARWCYHHRRGKGLQQLKLQSWVITPDDGVKISLDEVPFFHYLRSGVITEVVVLHPTGLSLWRIRQFLKCSP